MKEGNDEFQNYCSFERKLKKSMSIWSKLATLSSTFRLAEEEIAKLIERDENKTSGAMNGGMNTSTNPWRIRTMMTAPGPIVAAPGISRLRKADTAMAEPNTLRPPIKAAKFQWHHETRTKSKLVPLCSMSSIQTSHFDAIVLRPQNRSVLRQPNFNSRLKPFSISINLRVVWKD